MTTFYSLYFSHLFTNTCHKLPAGPLRAAFHVNDNNYVHFNTLLITDVFTLGSFKIGDCTLSLRLKRGGG